MRKQRFVRIDGKKLKKVRSEAKRRALVAGERKRDKGFGCDQSLALARGSPGKKPGWFADGPAAFASLGQVD